MKEFLARMEKDFDLAFLPLANEFELTHDGLQLFRHITPENYSKVFKNNIRKLSNAADIDEDAIEEFVKTADDYAKAIAAGKKVIHLFFTAPESVYEREKGNVFNQSFAFVQDNVWQAIASQIEDIY